MKRAVTLRASSRRHQNGPVNDRTPLLSSTDSSQDDSSTSQSILFYGRQQVEQAWHFAWSPTGQAILKCSLAYLLGSMATFVTPVANFLGQQDGKHTVATITVYFHPARSQGSMYEATILAALAFLYASFISFTSMGVSIAFSRLSLKTIGHALVLVLFCGGGLGFVGWVKQRLGSPLVNVACSLASLAIITVLTKEGAVQTSTFSHDKVVQVMKMVIMGILISTFVSLVYKPTSAQKQLRYCIFSAAFKMKYPDYKLEKP